MPLRGLKMRYVGAFSLVAGSLIGLASLPECANAQSNTSNPYALDRLFLTATDRLPLYDPLSFNSIVGVENYFGVSSVEGALARDFFAGYTGDSANMIFTRYPE